jgi:phage shock protein A
LSTLTKVFIVVLVVFSIAFTTMTVSIVAQSTDWRDTALKYEEHARVADTNLRNQIAASAAELATARDSIKSHLEKIGELETQLKGSGTELAKLRSDLAKAESEKSSSEAMNRGLLAQLTIADAGRAEYRKQRDEIEKRNIELERRNIDLNDRVNEQTARIAVLFEQKRQYEQQLNILKTENEKLAREAHRPAGAAVLEEPSGAAMPNVTALSPISATPIRGKVLDVSGNIITISVGTADGVKKDMVFVITRGGDQYVGDLRISSVTPNQAAGRMVRSASPPTPPTAGDQVTDESAMRAARK